MYGFRLEMVPKKTIHWYWKRIQGIRDQLAGFGDGISPNKGFHWKEKGPASDPEIFWIKTENGIRYDQMFCETGETKFKMTSSSAASGFGSRHFDASSFWIHIPIRNTCYLICQNMLPGKKKQGWAKKRNSFWLNIHLFTIHPTITSRLPGCYISSKCSHGIPQCCWYIHPILLSINSHCIPIKITSKHIKTMILFHHIPMDMPFTFHHFPFDLPTSSSFHHSKSQHFSSVLPVLLHRKISQDPTKARSPWAKAPQSSSRLTSAMHIRKASTSMPLASVSSMSSMNWVKKVTSRIFGGFLKGISWSNVLGWHDDHWEISWLLYHGNVMGWPWDDHHQWLVNHPSNGDWTLCISGNISGNIIALYGFISWDMAVLASSQDEYGSFLCAKRLETITIVYRDEHTFRGLNPKWAVELDGTGNLSSETPNSNGWFMDSQFMDYENRQNSV